MTAEQSQVACCIRDTARYLAQDASEAGLLTLAYLLEMTAMEAEAADTKPRRRRDNQTDATATAH
jgi:hypothetical protein